MKSRLGFEDRTASISFNLVVSLKELTSEDVVTPGKAGRALGAAALGWVLNGGGVKCKVMVIGYVLVCISLPSPSRNNSSRTVAEVFLLVGGERIGI
jgi:hypothetical protein